MYISRFELFMTMTSQRVACRVRYKCDECQGFIVGTRIHCETCEDFDLCVGCQSAGQYPPCHSVKHDVTRIPMVKLKLNTAADSTLHSYIHQHVWLSYVSLSLNMAGILYHSAARHSVDAEYVHYATQLHNTCIELVNTCLMFRLSPDQSAYCLFLCVRVWWMYRNTYMYV